MSVRVMSWVWEHSDSEGIDRLVLLALADQARDDGGNAYPSIALLARKAKVSTRTVQRSIRALVLLGEVSVDMNAGKHGVNVYTIRMDPRLTDTGDDLTPPSVRHTSQLDTVTPVTPRGDNPVTRTVKNHPLPPKPPADARAQGAPKKGHCGRHSFHRATCQRCGDVESGLANERALLAAAIAKCQACEGMGWVLDDDKKPTKQRCRHLDVLGSSEMAAS